MRATYILTNNKAEQVIKEALTLTDNVRVDELNCVKSFARKSTDKSLEWILQHAFNDKNTLWFYILRNMSWCSESNYFDIGCITKCKENNIDYFVWIELNEETGIKLANKYKLKLL